MRAAVKMDHWGCKGLVAHTAIVFPGTPLGVTRSLRASVTLSVAAAAAATLESTRVPSSSPPAPLRASSVTSLVLAIASVCSLIAMTFQAPAPPLASKVSSLSQGEPPLAAAAVVMSPVTAGVAWQTVLWSVMVAASPMAAVCASTSPVEAAAVVGTVSLAEASLSSARTPTGRVVGDVVGVSCSSCDCDCVDVGGLLPSGLRTFFS